jgi:hypothetical protein
MPSYDRFAPSYSVSTYQPSSLAGGALADALIYNKAVVAVISIVVILAVVYGVYLVLQSFGVLKLGGGKKDHDKDKKEHGGESGPGVPPPAPDMPPAPLSAFARAVRGSIMDQHAGLMREEREGEVLMKDSAEPSAGARALPSPAELAEQSMAQYAELAQTHKPGDRTRQEGENPMFHSQFYYEEGVEQHAEPGSGDAEKEVMSNLVSATGGLLTQAEDLFASGNDAYERDAWGMYKPSLATLQKARDLGSRVAGGVLAQASDGWGGRSVGGNGVTADPSRSLYGLQDQLADTTKVPVETFVQNVLRGDITAGGALPLSNLPSYITG